MVTSYTHDSPGTSTAAWSAAPGWESVGTVDLAGVERLVVVAAHPDDETLGAGGLMATAAAGGVPVRLVVCTNGEASHPDSPTHPPEALARLRREEVRAAFAEVAPDGDLVLLDLPDGDLAAHEEALATTLVDDLGDARSTLVVAPWRADGHPDHEAAGRAAATAAHRCGARLWEYPIWWWHWATPDQAPWPLLRRLPLTPDARAARARALDRHRTQVDALSEAAGDEALLQPGFLAHFTGPADRFVVAPTADDALDTLHRDDDDPWQVDRHWYERRKRDLTLAVLPRPRFRRGLEVGCSVGALTVELAGRCDAVVAVDSSGEAVRAAQQRVTRELGPRAPVEVTELAAPEEWPAGAFDLVVLSEVGYFLSPVALEALIDRVREALTDDGVVVLCHWRHPISGWPLDAAAVHEAFLAADLRPLQCRHTEADVELLALASPEAWTDPRR